MNLSCSIPRNWRRRIFFLLACLCIGLVSLCAFFRIRSSTDVVAYYSMSRECHPIWRDLAMRRIHADDSAADFLRRHSPNRREEFGEYALYTYYQTFDGTGIPFTSISVIARDGQLAAAQASSCTWQFPFFGALDSAFTEAYSVFIDKHVKKARQEIGVPR